MATGVLWVKLDRDSSTQSRTMEDWPVAWSVWNTWEHRSRWPALELAPSSALWDTSLVVKLSRLQNESRLSYLAEMKKRKKESVLKFACLCMIYTVLAGFSHEKSDCSAFLMLLDGNRSPAAVCAPAQCCRGNFFCLISQQNTLACTQQPWNDFAVPKTLPHSNSNKETTKKGKINSAASKVLN